LRSATSGVRHRNLVSEQEAIMANPVPAGSDVSAGTYRCTECGYELDVASTQHLPPCPSCSNGEWSTVSGGDAADDPYPDRA
jgi:lipopolysaccharide biosynthesis regulator YciM